MHTAKKQRLSENGQHSITLLDDALPESDEAALAAPSTSAISTMQLKRVIKENHRQPIEHVEFCFTATDVRYKNLVATVADTQVNIYDNEHHGNNLDPLLHFVNAPTIHHQQQQHQRNKGHETDTVSLKLHTCCWIIPNLESRVLGETLLAPTSAQLSAPDRRLDESTARPRQQHGAQPPSISRTFREDGRPTVILHDDVFLACGGDDCMVHVLSVCEAQVVSLLRGHTDSIVALASHPTRPHSILLSAARDKTIRIWDWVNEQCLNVVEATVSFMVPTNTAWP